MGKSCKFIKLCYILWSELITKPLISEQVVKMQAGLNGKVSIDWKSIYEERGKKNSIMPDYWIKNYFILQTIEKICEESVHSNKP